MATWALVKGIREKKNNIWSRRRGGNWWKEDKKRDSLCIYMSQMSGGNCAGGLSLQTSAFLQHYNVYPSRSCTQKSSAQPWQIHHKRSNQSYIQLQAPTSCLVHFFGWWYIHEAFINLSFVAWNKASIIWLCDKDSCSWTPRMHHILGMDKWRKGPRGPFLATTIAYSSSFQLFSKGQRLFQLWTLPFQHSPSGRKAGAWLPTYCKSHLTALNFDLQYFSYWSNPVATL